MSTKAQRRANKRNAQLSTGPKTDEGKQRCSQNALQHGLRSKHPVIPGEDPAEYQHKLDKLRADLRPVNALEDSLVEQIADTSWRLKRLSRIEAAMDRKRIETADDKTENLGKDGEQILGDALSGWAGLDYRNRLSRYDSQLSRRYHRAIKDLRDLRKTHEQNFFRARPMEERDREEREWQERQRQQQPPPAPQPRPPAGAATVSAASGDNVEPNEQTQSLATNLDSMSWDEFGKLHPMQALKLIDENLLPNPTPTGQPGPQEAAK